MVEADGCAQRQIGCTRGVRLRSAPLADAWRDCGGVCIRSSLQRMLYPAGLHERTDGGAPIPILVGVFLVCLFVLFAVGGLILVQRLVPMGVRQRQNDVAGFIYAVLGVAYAVLLGLMLVAVWEQWEEAKATVDDEASQLAEIYWIAHQLPQPEGRHIQELAHSYAEVVVDEEWPLMAQGEFSPKAWATIDEIRDSVQSLNASTDDQLLLDQQALERMHGL